MHLWYNPCVMLRCQIWHIPSITVQVFTCVMSPVKTVCHNVMCVPLALHAVTRTFRVIDPRYQFKDVSGLHVQSSERLLSSSHNSWLHCYCITTSHSHQPLRLANTFVQLMKSVAVKVCLHHSFSVYSCMLSSIKKSNKPTVIVLSNQSLGLSTAVTGHITNPFSLIDSFWK